MVDDRESSHVSLPLRKTKFTSQAVRVQIEHCKKKAHRGETDPIDKEEEWYLVRADGYFVDLQRQAKQKLQWIDVEEHDKQEDEVEHDGQRVAEPIASEEDVLRVPDG